MSASPLSWGIALLGATLQQDATLLRSIRWRRRKAASHRCQAPFLDVGLNEVETSLSKIDVNRSRAVGANSREEVLSLETVNDLFQLLAITSEEDSTGSGTVSNTNNIALDIGRSVGCRVERLVIPPCACGLVGNGVLVEACSRLVSQPHQPRCSARTYQEA